MPETDMVETVCLVTDSSGTLWIWKGTLGDNFIQLNYLTDEVMEACRGEVICPKLHNPLRPSRPDLISPYSSVNFTHYFIPFQPEEYCFQISHQSIHVKDFMSSREKKELKQNSIMKKHYCRIQMYHHVDNEKFGLLKST